MIIYGAGLAGLITAHVLRRHKPIIREAQSTLPNNHEALLRFRTDAVERATGIPFRKVDVSKCICYQGRTFTQPDIQLNNLYSFKVTGEYHVRSIGNLADCQRYVAPPNLIAQLSVGLSVEYNCPLDAAHWPKDKEDSDPIISTVPMPIIMDLAGWQMKPEFRFCPIWSAWSVVLSPSMDLYQTIYYPDPELPYYRASITGNRIIVEFLTAPSAMAIAAYFDQILRDFGIGNQKISFSEIVVKEQKYGKLMPVDDSIRRRFIVALTDEYRIYSIGRFATWRQILMDDVVADAAHLDRWIMDREGDRYNRRLRS